MKSPAFSQILQEVAMYKPPSGFQQGCYVLKNELKSKYIPFWDRYNYEEAETATTAFWEYQDQRAKAQVSYILAQLIFLKNTTIEEIEHLEIPRLPELLAPFSRLSNILINLFF